jgi:hypothetical protein
MEKNRFPEAELIDSGTAPGILRFLGWPVRIALAALLLTALSGLMLRLYPFWAPGGFHFRNWTHAHSHLALLGWAWMGLYALGIHRYLSGQMHALRYVPHLSTGLTVSIAGMALTFPVTGYAAASIFFSTLHMALGIWFSVLVFRHGDRNAPGFRYFKIALLFMILSGFGPLALGPLAALDLRNTAWYRFCVYFYLHFQYHGWLTFGLIALAIGPATTRLRPSENTNLTILALTTVLTLMLSGLEFEFPAAVPITGGVAAAVQFGLLAYLGSVYLKNRIAVQGWPKILILLATSALLLKTLLLTGLMHPGFARLVYQSRDLVVAYLHLSLLGFVTLGILAAFIQRGWLPGRGYLPGVGLALFIAAFLLQEAFLSARGLRLPMDRELLLAGNALLLISAAGMTAGLALVIFPGFRRGQLTPLSADPRG